MLRLLYELALFHTVDAGVRNVELFGYGTQAHATCQQG